MRNTKFVAKVRRCVHVVGGCLCIRRPQGFLAPGAKHPKAPTRSAHGKQSADPARADVSLPSYQANGPAFTDNVVQRNIS